MSKLIPDLYRSARPAHNASLGFRPHSRLATLGEPMCGDIWVLTDRLSQARPVVVCARCDPARLREGDAAMDCDLFELPAGWNA